MSKPESGTAEKTAALAGVLDRQDPLAMGKKLAAPL
jgi:hypothetical protein